MFLKVGHRFDMLKSFIYLDVELLHQLIGAAEDGLVTEQAVESGGEGSVSGRAGFKGLGIEAKHAGSNKTTTQLDDTDSARFTRLIQFCKTNSEQAEWLSVEDPASAIEATTGKLVELTADTYVPDFIKYVSQYKQISGVLELAGQLKGLVPGINDDDVQSVSSMNSKMSPIASLMKDKLVICGDCAGFQFRCVGKIKPQYVIGDEELEGDEYRIVGKVRSSWKRGEWKNMLSLPGMDFMSREQRRKMMKEEPTEENKNQYVEGPAIQLQILAIYV
ncbi:DUF6414 family protein [Bifidobacterium crudilactis]|jgi:hypothetical protein|uniref:DUF6414 family protein n=1 Tax=Bifidobacterium crudilactis TaxID=327277 RepID=UPI002352559C|nr:hypothetical protein [Bifidobacterium crudilactis]MCI1868705.1 hypothetical protein [Bifidobacterium crudilactis]